MHSFRSTVHVDPFVDLSSKAADLGFLVPVSVSRFVHDTIIVQRSPCACPICEEGASNLMDDRRERLLLGLRDAIEALSIDTNVVEFALDVGKKGAKGKARKIFPLRALLGPSEFQDPVIVVTRADEVHDEPLTSLAMGRPHGGE